MSSFVTISSKASSASVLEYPRPAVLIISVSVTSLSNSPGPGYKKYPFFYAFWNKKITLLINSIVSNPTFKCVIVLNICWLQKIKLSCNAQKIGCNKIVCDLLKIIFACNKNNIACNKIYMLAVQNTCSQ